MTCKKSLLNTRRYWRICFIECQPWTLLLGQTCITNNVDIIRSSSTQLNKVFSQLLGIGYINAYFSIPLCKQMYFLKHLWGDMETQFLASVLYSSATFSEIFSYTACRQLLQMFFAIIFFHGSEYILAIGIHGSNVTLKSLLISKNYLLAMVFSLLEYLVEMYFFPGLKEHWWISNLGLAMVVIGEIIRKLAIITAGQAFTHHIKIYHEERHKLITHGVYRFIRHPGYCGFFIWSIGTQIMLCNPISMVAFAIVVWHFFSQRIPYEEYFLRQFFGSQYEDYARQVASGIPFVK